MTSNPKKNLLIVWHSRTGTARQMADAARQGAEYVASEFDATDRLEIVTKQACDTQADDLLQADGYVFCGPENLASLSGEMKEFFDRNYYPVLEQLNGRPYALLISAGSDGSMAAKQATRICTGWRLQEAAPVLIVNTSAQTPEAILAPKQITEQNRQDSHEKGATVAALLLL